MKKVIWLTAVFGTLLVVSCDKSTDINIITPIEGQTFHSNEIVDVKAKFYDPDILGGVTLTAIGQSGDTIYSHSIEVSGQSYTLQDRFSLRNSGICTVKCSAWGGYGGSKSVMIYVE